MLITIEEGATGGFGAFVLQSLAEHGAAGPRPEDPHADPAGHLPGPRQARGHVRRGRPRRRGHRARRAQGAGHRTTPRRRAGAPKGDLATGRLACRAPEPLAADCHAMATAARRAPQARVREHRASHAAGDRRRACHRADQVAGCRGLPSHPACLRRRLSRCGLELQADRRCERLRRPTASGADHLAACEHTRMGRVTHPTAAKSAAGDERERLQHVRIRHASTSPP